MDLSWLVESWETTIRVMAAIAATTQLSRTPEQDGDLDVVFPCEEGGL